MNEVHRAPHEYLPKTESLAPKNGHESKHHQELHEQARRSTDTSRERAAEARQIIEKEQGLSREQAEATLSEKTQHDTTEVRWWSSELKAQTLERTLSSVRRRLSRPEKSFSKVIHQRTIEQISDVSAKTIARPSGILVGSIFAFIGSLLAYLLARRIGGELSPSVGILFFTAGFTIGIVGEFLIHLIRKLYSRHSES